MPSMLSRIFHTIGNRPTATFQRHIPMLNELSLSLQSYFTGMNQISRKQALISWYKGIPELTALVNKIARDGTRNFHFEPVGNGGNGRNRVMKANSFVQMTQYRRIKFSEWVDRLVTGESYKWLGKITDAQIKEAVSKSYKGLETKESQNVLNRLLELKQTDELGVIKGIDEDVLKPRKLRYLASSTMEVIHDDYDVLGYMQNVGAKKEQFNSDEIIRGVFMDVDGKISGFTPVESILVQLELLRFMWQNMLSIHKNGGSPDNIVVLEDMKDVNSPAYKRIEEQLRKYKLVENKHGNMLFTGKVNIHELNAIEKMQFMDMGLYITGLIAMQWGIPRSDIPYIVGGANTKDDTGGNSQKGYWETIEGMQQLDADIDNVQLWIPHFGVMMVHDNSYINRDVQAQQALQLKYNNLKLLGDMAMQSKKKLKFDFFVKEIGMNNEDFEDMKEEEIMQITGNLNEQLPKTASDSDAKKGMKDAKRNEAKRVEDDKGKSTGQGKETVFMPLDFASFVEGKEIEKKESQQVDFDNFIKIYSEDKAYHPGTPPRVFMYQNELFTTFRFKSSDFVYQTMVKNEDLSTVKLMNINNIYRV